MTLVRRRRFAIALLVAIALTVPGWLILRGESIRDHLADWVDTGCSSVQNEERPPDAFYRIPRGFAQRAIERASVACLTGGPGAFYFRFTDTNAARHALAAFPEVLNAAPCLVGDAMFTTNELDPGTPRTYCHRLHGVLETSRLR